MRNFGIKRVIKRDAKLRQMAKKLVLSETKN